MTRRLQLLSTLMITCTFFACGETTQVNLPGNTQDESTDSTSTTEIDPFERQPVSDMLTFTHGGIERAFYLHIPEDLPADAPLVAVMHGYTGSAQNIMAYSDLNTLANQHGFAVFYPQGTKDSSDNRFFHVGYDFHISEGVTVDDLDFIKTLTAHLQSTYQLSTDNVFATGMSNGAEMSYLLGCKASQMFKAVAPVAGMMLTSLINECAPTRPMPVFEIHGTDDYVTYTGGDINNEDGWGAYPATSSIIDFWVDFNNLDRSSNETLPPTAEWYGHSVSFDRYYSTESEAEVWLYTVLEGEHDWPGAGTGSVGASKAVWQFFSQYVSPPSD